MSGPKLRLSRKPGERHKLLCSKTQSTIAAKLHLASGVWALPCAPGECPACAWGVWVALGTPQCGWAGAGPGVGLVAVAPPMCPQVFFFRVRFPCWGQPG